MRADIRGDAKGPAVVLLHGQPGTAGDWQWVEPLIDPGFRVIVPDRPGYGRTGGQATGFAGNADAVEELLDDLKVPAAIVVGHSWAGGVAMAFAAAHPERTRGIVLVSSVGPGEHLGWDDRLMARPVVGELIAATTIGGIGYLLGRSRVQKAGLRLHGKPRDALVALTRLTSSSKGVWRSFVTEQRALLHELESLQLARITAPTVIIHGDHDRLVPASVAHSNHAAIANARLEMITRGGHLIPHDHPTAVAKAIEELT